MIQEEMLTGCWIFGGGGGSQGEGWWGRCDHWPCPICAPRSVRSVLPRQFCQCLSKTLVASNRVPWTARTSMQSILKEISPEYSLEGLMLKLKLQYFGYLMRRTDSLEKTLMLGKIEGRRRRG